MEKIVIIDDETEIFSLKTEISKALNSLNRKIDLYYSRPEDTTETISRLKDTHTVIVTKATTEINNDVIENLPSLKHIAVFGTALDHIDENAAKLLDGNRTDYDPVNTLDGAFPVEMNQRYLVDDFIPIWGSVRLNENEQVTGMLVYEVPKGSSFSQLRWRATDTAVIHYD